MGGNAVAGAVRVAAGARVLVPELPAPVTAVEAGRLAGGRIIGRRDGAAGRGAGARGSARPRAEPVSGDARRGAVPAAVLGLLARPRAVAVRRRGTVARALPQRQPRGATADPVAGLRRAADAVVAGRRLALVASGHAAQRGRGRGRDRVLPGLAGGGGRRRGHASRAVLDRPAVQPDARLRGAHRAARRHLRRRRARERPARRRLGAVGLAGDARGGAGLPPAARPDPGPRRPPLRPRALRRGAARPRFPRRRARGAGGARGHRRGARRRTRRPGGRGRVPPARDRRLRRPWRPACSTGCPTTGVRAV